MSGRKPKAKAGPKSEAQSTTRGRFGGSAARSHGEDKPNARLKEKRAQRPAGAALRARPRLASMTRLLAFIATLLLGAAASAHVPRVAANFAPTIEYATAVETHAQSAPCAAKTARPARAKIAAQESACASALTHCRVWRNPTSSQNRTSSRGVYAYTAFGENDPAGTSGNTTGTTENNYRYTGEQLDPNLGFYYLRARYMDPRVGRFVGMDEHPGTDSDPISTHRFQYAHHSPISNTDPSGFETLAGQSTAMNATVRNSLNASINTFRTFANRAVSYTIQTTRAARQAVRKCLRDTKKCPLAIPTLVVGRNFPNAALHIQQSQLGHGTNMVGAGFLYTYLKRKKTAWYNRYSECSVFKRKVAEARFGGMVGCDEFPFFASRQGGPENYPGKVSLRFIPYIENRQVGLLFAGMVSASRMKTNDHFLVVADPDIEISLFIPFRKH